MGRELEAQRAGAAQRVDEVASRCDNDFMRQWHDEATG
jgi:hypothetical protein